MNDEMGQNEVFGVNSAIAAMIPEAKHIDRSRMYKIVPRQVEALIEEDETLIKKTSYYFKLKSD